MPSPFPGMDPYLERYSGDVHAKLIVYACDQISEELPEDLHARVEETAGIDVEAGESRWIYPDVQVVEEPATPAYATPAAGGVAVSEPRVIVVPGEAPPQRHIQVVDPNSGHRVVTAIELLSPANKSTESGRRLYREKQRSYIQGHVNLVEIDLVRSGSFILAVPELAVPADCHSPYLVCVRRARWPDRAELYPITLREPLPNIRVPLRPSDADIVLRLQPLFDECYRSGRYGTIDYRQPPHPPLGEDDARWAEALLREKALRPE